MPRVFLLLLLMVLPASQAALAEQVCKYDSIPATAPASRFTDNGDGTVTDTATGLQWKRCAEGQTWIGGTCTGSVTTHTWWGALQLADAATYAGQSDWRLPNIKELSSIVERACRQPAIDLAVFPFGSPSFTLFSASPDASAAHKAWIVDFAEGNIRSDYKGSNYFGYITIRVILVRGGV
jgi:hypothetical protein